uniref:Uncharacterized protein n=1 Tax=Arundo donax TaxID=35708 RepID=A0A0A9BR04_ARUDO
MLVPLSANYLLIQSWIVLCTSYFGLLKCTNFNVLSISAYLRILW